MFYYSNDCVQIKVTKSIEQFIDLIILFSPLILKTPVHPS